MDKSPLDLPICLALYSLENMPLPVHLMGTQHQETWPGSLEQARNLRASPGSPTNLLCGGRKPRPLSELGFPHSK